MDILKNDWGGILNEEFGKSYYLSLREFLKEEYASKTVFPKMEDIFNALHHTPFERVKAVILGQDPYHGPDQAHGLSFSVQPGMKIPPSLRNIFKELQEDIGASPPSDGYLVKWAEQGVLMLNTVLTVRKGEAHSHKGKGWETFTDRIIESLNKKDDKIVYLLWGSAAQAKIDLIDTDKHAVLTSPHPSPFSARKGFFGSRPFSRTNEILRKNGIEEIDWKL